MGCRAVRSTRYIGIRGWYAPYICRCSMHREGFPRGVSQGNSKQLSSKQGKATPCMTGSFSLTRRLFVSAFFLFSLILLPMKPAVAQQINPIQVCAADGGKTWYFSLGRVVFERKINVAKLTIDPTFVENVDPSAILQAPDPKAPIGCKDNPQQLRYYSTTGWPQLEWQHQTDMPQVPMLLELWFDPVMVSVRKEAGQLYFPVWMQDCTGYFKVIHDWPNGTEYCTNSQQALKGSSVGGGELLVPRAVYAMPMSWQKLSVMNGFEGIDTTYFLSDFITINYRIQYKPPPLEEFPKRAIEFDRSLRAALLAQELPDYRWPD